MRQKLIRFEANKLRKNIIEPGKPLFDQIKGHWNEIYFEEEQPIVVELGCGNGEYTVGLAEQDPDKNYIGVDVKGDRIFVGSTYAIENNLKNVGFLRTSVHQLENFFEENEVTEIWITFPDPRPKEREEKRRLTFPRFMEIYRKILCEDGTVKLKTDNTGFFEYTLELLHNEKIKYKALDYTADLENSPLKEEHFGIETKYERIWKAKGSKIKYLKFKFENYN
ncbi:MAG: tRNA (guanosine(46)-N7)-methyltransferase TrmB [Cyclobacteriaceae bacterium]